MEHQNNTFLDPPLSNKEGIVVHELAHHWWGNWVTCRDWYHIWLNEGFATYCGALFYEVLYGTGYYQAFMENAQWAIPSGGSVYVSDTTDPDNIFGGLQYNKGAFVLHMLRHLIGDSALFASMKLYGETYAHQNTVTEDFRDVCEAVSGIDLDIFFQQWIYGVDWPIYRYSYLIRRAPDFGGWNTYINLEQTQTTEPLVYSTPVEFDLWYGPGFGTYQVMNTLREEGFVINTPFEPDSIGFDPHGWLLETHQVVPYTLHIISDSLDNTVQGSYYEDTILIISANDSYSAEITSGQLPRGWSLGPTTGIISGLSYDVGYHTFTVQATDALEPEYSDTRELTVHIEDMGYGPGDANLDGDVNVGDVVFLINHIFKGGPPPSAPNWADPNADCQINVGDAVYLINFVFNSGPAPQLGCVE
jgi:hypothetical protein